MSKSLDTSSEEFRALCEARMVMRLPRADRQSYYQQVLKARGQAALDRLVQDVKVEWARTQAHAHESDHPTA